MSAAQVRIRRKAEPEFTRVDDELLGVNTQDGLVYSLNRSASRIWELLEDWTTVDTISAQLQREFKVDPQTCDAHVRKLVARLGDAGLVERQEGAAQ
jgi:hypothetical protein